MILIVGSVILTGACFANGGFDYLASLFESGDMSVRLIRPLTDTAVDRGRPRYPSPSAGRTAAPAHFFAPLFFEQGSSPFLMSFLNRE